MQLFPTANCRLISRMLFASWRLASLMLLVSASSFCRGESMEKDYGVPENSIVATPVGYEKNMTLSEGEVVKLYPDRLFREEVTNCHAVLFCILSPQTERGRRFLFQHNGCTCPMCALPSSLTNLYQIGKYYLFEHPHTVSNILLSAYDAVPPAPELKMERDWGRPLYCSIGDVDARILELENSVLEDKALIKELQAQLLQIPNESSHRKTRHALRCRISQIEQWVTNRIPRVRAELHERGKWLCEREDGNKR